MKPASEFPFGFKDFVFIVDNICQASYPLLREIRIQILVSVAEDEHGLIVQLYQWRIRIKFRERILKGCVEQFGKNSGLFNSLHFRIHVLMRIIIEPQHTKFKP